MTLRARLAKLENGAGGLRRVIIAVIGAKADPIAAVNEVGLSAGPLDTVVVVRKPGDHAVSVSVVAG
jgi:hypothetical protein